MLSNENRIVSTAKQEADTIDYAFRPERLDEFIGQQKIKDNLRVYIQAARQRNEALDHILLAGPPGLGKTTLAHIIARELQVNIKVLQAPVLEKTRDIAAILTNLSEKDILFIDEIHRLKNPIEETLYSAMEDYKIDVLIGQGPGAKSVRISIPTFTLIGATTRSGMLTNPLLTRFGISFRLDLYEPEVLQQLALRTAQLLSLSITKDAAYEVARRSRGTPRIVNRLMRRLRDFAQVGNIGTVTIDYVNSVMTQLDIDANGLDQMDRRILATLIEKYSGGPVGLETLAISVEEEIDNIQDVYEPFLIQQGFLSRTVRGRIATPLAYRYFGYAPPATPSLQPTLFTEENS